MTTLDIAHRDNAPDADLDALVRRVDPDRWLASRFIADPKARADVIALYAFNYELARVAGGVSNALMGEIRLTWWREAMEEIAAGQIARKHPAVQAVAAAGYPLSALAEMAQARLADLDDAPFETEAQVLAYVDATAGAVMMLAAWRLDAKADLHAVQDAARTYGLAGLWRLKRAGVQRLPADWTQGDVRRRVDAARRKANAALKALPVAAFPAAAPAALAMAQTGGRELGALETQVRLTWAVATGRI
ncbi:phytoene synthase [Caulobacter sp. Root487D2Y]|uniref:squalene/phytoene synthase family protein n=1 Tax=Caulobacter sp. Root487D2Y TaxID=1736547 RepID=UPI0006FDBE4E|nr:squalene/phytoene synthase family protein [Caulobacter sp. Root487D2Y]KQY30097.1 phytoene synthase [Caulobacter sp. Root487D2Y]